MKSRGRPIFAMFSGFLFGLFVAFDLLLFNVIPLNSVVITILPIIGLVVTPAIAIFAPFGKHRAAKLRKET